MRSRAIPSWRLASALCRGVTVSRFSDKASNGAPASSKRFTIAGLPKKASRRRPTVVGECVGRCWISPQQRADTLHVSRRRGLRQVQSVASAPERRKRLVGCP